MTSKDDTVQLLETRLRNLTTDELIKYLDQVNHDHNASINVILERLVTLHDAHQQMIDDLEFFFKEFHSDPEQSESLQRTKLRFIIDDYKHETLVKGDLLNDAREQSSK